MVYYFAERKILAVFLSVLFLSACSSPTGWRSQQLGSSQTQYHAGKIYFPPENQGTGVELELVRSALGLKGYLNVFTRTVPTRPDHPTESLVTLIIAGETETITAYRYQGGQKLLLPDEVTSRMVTALQAHEDVLISVKGFRSLVVAEGFERVFHKLDNLPLTPRPQQR